MAKKKRSLKSIVKYEVIVLIPTLIVSIFYSFICARNEYMMNFYQAYTQNNTFKNTQEAYNLIADCTIDNFFIRCGEYLLKAIPLIIAIAIIVWLTVVIVNARKRKLTRKEFDME